MVLIINSLTNKSEKYRKDLRYFMRSRMANKGKIELIFSQSTQFNNLLVECEMTFQFMGEDIQKIFAVGYSEEDVFTDVILKFKALTENKFKYQIIDKATV